MAADGDFDPRILRGDCRARLYDLPEASADAVVTDPPYDLTDDPQLIDDRDDPTVEVARRRGFMSNLWDGGNVAFRVSTWQAVARVMKPGAPLLAFSATRTWHLQAAAMELAGLVVVGTPTVWAFGSGFPKNQNVSAFIDKHLGLERTERAGVKAGHENFVGRDNVRSLRESGALAQEGGFSRPWMFDPEKVEDAHWDYKPASPQAEEWDGWGTALKPAWEPIVVAWKPGDRTLSVDLPAILYCAKATADERPKVNGVEHSTVKPLNMMKDLVRGLNLLDGAVVLEPFLGSGTTAEVCEVLGIDWRGVELCDGTQAEMPNYLPLIQSRIDRARAGRSPLQPGFARWKKAEEERLRRAAAGQSDLFDLLEAS